MTSPEDTAIRLRHDGSIDTPHYMALGRKRRAEAAAALVKTTQAAAKPARPSLLAWLQMRFAPGH